ncbi:nitrile hydratase accessory protein, partial [Mesorhizobium sp. M00.F.Ca.ET.158.01.1.1]
MSRPEAKGSPARLPAGLDAPVFAAPWQS